MTKANQSMTMDRSKELRSGEKSFVCSPKAKRKTGFGTFSHKKESKIDFQALMNLHQQVSGHKQKEPPKVSNDEH